MGWICIPELSKKCAKFIDKNPHLKISKFVCRNGNFLFYKEYVNMQKIKYEDAVFRLCLVTDKKGYEGWSVDYMRHTGKWQPLPIFGAFEHCLKEIKSGTWGVLMPWN
ncbi:MAG: hypothetical protein QME12_02020 [Nanoarchaeota archaeon]|nr:hypothetical protein [Nanoarchaeota archaeon]